MGLTSFYDVNFLIPREGYPRASFVGISFHDVKFQSAFFSREVGLNSPVKFDCFGVSLLYLRLVLQSPVGMLLLENCFSDEAGRRMFYPGICLIWLHLDYVSPQ